jgi:hypothetical protein
MKVYFSLKIKHNFFSIAIIWCNKLSFGATSQQGQQDAGLCFFLFHGKLLQK